MRSALLQCVHSQQATITAHRRILDAIAAGDPQEAVAAMAAYLSETGEDLGATIREQTLPQHPRSDRGPDGSPWVPESPPASRSPFQYLCHAWDLLVHQTADQRTAEDDHAYADEPGLEDQDSSDGAVGDSVGCDQW